MEYRVVSNRELSEIDLSRIRSIMAESECPNEPLMDTFQDYIGIDQEVIVIGSSGGEYHYNLVI